jgi:glycerol kinase
MSVLAIDQGTTSTSAMVVDSHGIENAMATIEHSQSYPHPGWVEHDADELITNIFTCIDTASDVSAIGLDNQGESCLAWHADTKEAVTPVIVWQDDRTRQTIENLKSDGVEPQILDATGLPLDSYFSASKLAWIVQTVPDARDLLAKGKLRLGTTDAFFLDRLSGHYVTDITTASRTSLMNLATGQWDANLCEIFGVPMEALPRIVPTTGDFGTVHADGRNIPITASIVDQQASLYGHGCRSRGDAKVTFGTGAFALTLTGETISQAPEKGLLPTVAWQFAGFDPVYALDGGVYTASAAINWAKSLGLFQNLSEINQFDKPHAIERNLAFVPALSGLACPHWDRSAVGLWIGLTLDTTPQDMMQAVLEGVAFRAAEVLSAMSQHVTTPDVNGPISIDGGMSANPYFCQFFSDIVERDVAVPHLHEMTAFGTAMLALPDVTEKLPPRHETTLFHPSTNASSYCDKFSEAVRRSQNW